MLDHAFGALGLHRIALFVFEFNERAVRAYKRCGFVIEGRARESIWRDGRWWDELAMSVLESDWRKRRAAAEAEAGDATTAAPDGARASGSCPCPRARRVVGRVRSMAAGHRAAAMTTATVAADAARAEVRELIGAKGHAVDNARAAVARLEAAFAAGDLERTPAMDQYLADLMQALEQDEGQKLGGKSAEASRFILRAIDRELDNA